MVIQNKSIQGAYDKAIEDAAGRIHAASRPPRTHSSSYSTAIKNVEDESSDNVHISDDKSSIVLSPQPSDDNDSDEICALGSDNSRVITTGDCYNLMDDDDIVSNLLFLEEKKRILKKAKLRNEKEEAYIALNAYDISNRREPGSQLVGSSSIWLEAKEIVEKFAFPGEKGIRSEGDEEQLQDLVPSSIEDQGNTASSSDPSPDICSPPLPLSSSSSPPPPQVRSSLSLSRAATTITTTATESCVKKTTFTRKRPRIDLSMVRQVSSAEFSKECVEVDLTKPHEEYDRKCITGKILNRKNCVSPTSRCQQVREMLIATDSSNWISESVLKQILVLSGAAITEYQRSIIATGKVEYTKPELRSSLLLL